MESVCTLCLHARWLWPGLVWVFVCAEFPLGFLSLFPRCGALSLQGRYDLAFVSVKISSYQKQKPYVFVSVEPYDKEHGLWSCAWSMAPSFLAGWPLQVTVPRLFFLIRSGDNTKHTTGSWWGGNDLTHRKTSKHSPEYCKQRVSVRRCY